MSKRTSRIFLSCGSLIAVGLLYLLFANPLDGQTEGELAQFFGRFHPVILHSPIGFVGLLVILECCSLSRTYSHFEVAVPLVLLLSILSTLGAVATGMLLAYGEGANSALALSHMRDGVLLALALLGLGACRLLKVDLRWLYRGVLAVCILFLSLASHQGGSLTHGSGYLTKYMPNGMRPIFGLERIESDLVENREDLIVFKHLVQPIVEQNCLSCHNPDKLKGELNLETYEGHLAGGEIGPAIVPSDVDASEFLFRVTLPQNDEEFMPPDEKPPLSEAEIALIDWWVQNGAPVDSPVSAFKEIPSKVDLYISEVFNQMLSPEELERIEKERTQLYADLAELKDEFGVLVFPVEENGSAFSLQTYSAQKAFDDDMLKSLEPFASRFVEADLSGTQLTDAALKSLGKFENLKSLNLSRTRLTGKSLSELSKLEALESLNLYGTKLEGGRLEELIQLTQLKRLYVFQTEAGEGAALSRLRESLPECEIFAVQ